MVYFKKFRRKNKNVYSEMFENYRQLHPRDMEKYLNEKLSELPRS